MVLLVTQENVDVRELAGQIASGEILWKDGVEPRPEGHSSGSEEQMEAEHRTVEPSCEGDSGKDSEADMVGEQGEHEQLDSGQLDR